MAQNSVKPLKLTSMVSAAVAGIYNPIDNKGFAAAPFFIRINNASNQAITVSYNGIDDHEFIPANSIFELASQTNSQPGAQVALFPKHTIVFIKGIAGLGTIYLSGYFV